MISIKNVTKNYGKFKAVDDISLEAKPGEIYGFLGPNGAGKTTTIKMLVGLLEQNSGSISVAGIDVRREPLLSKTKFSYVPDNPEVYENLTGMSYLNFLADIHKLSSEVREERIKYYASKFEFMRHLQQYISSYSHGMKQKIVLIGALISEPEVLILDEPMVGLDPKSAFILKNLMRERCEKGNTVFFSTHVMEVAEKLCDRIAIIKKGKIIAEGSLDEIRSNVGTTESLEELFLELTEDKQTEGY